MPGITRLIYHVGYRIDENAQDFLRAANIEVVNLNYVSNGINQAMIP